MAFDFGSDILVDAMRAADPRLVDAARSKLDASSRVAEAGKAAVQSFSDVRAKIHRPTGSDHGDAEVMKKFEAAVLTTFVQAMMPKEASAVFGEGLAGDMWKAQLAEQLAGQLAQRGGVGIASRLLKDHQQAGDGIEAVSGLNDPALAIHETRAQDGMRRFLDSLQLDTLGIDDERSGGSSGTSI